MLALIDVRATPVSTTPLSAIHTFLPSSILFFGIRVGCWSAWHLAPPVVRLAVRNLRRQRLLPWSKFRYLTPIPMRTEIESRVLIIRTLALGRRWGHGMRLRRPSIRTLAVNHGTVGPAAFHAAKSINIPQSSDDSEARSPSPLCQTNSSLDLLRVWIHVLPVLYLSWTIKNPTNLIEVEVYLYQVSGYYRHSQNRWHNGAQ